MSIKYSEIEGALNCEVSGGQFNYPLIGGETIVSQPFPRNDYIPSGGGYSLAFLKGLVLAEMANDQVMLTIFRNSRWNLIRQKDGLLLDYGALQPIKCRPVIRFVGSIFLNQRALGIFVDKDNDVAYISDNAYTVHSFKFKPNILKELTDIDEPYCIAMASNDPGIGYCGNARKCITYDWKTGGFNV